MIDLLDPNAQPSLGQLGEYVRTEAFPDFCRELEETYKARPSIQFSRCSWEPGWNVKWKKSGRSLCTCYLREGYFTAMIVVGEREKEAAEAMLPSCAPRLREIYAQTREGNGQRWLMVDLEDRDEVYRDVLHLVAIRSGEGRL